MTGKKLIVVKNENAYQFHEHTTLVEAQREARRLAQEVGGTFIIYAPVAIIRRPAPQVTEETVMPHSMLQAFRQPSVSFQDDDDLPF